MDLLPTQDQQEIAGAAGELLTKELPIVELVARAGEPRAISDKAWEACAGMGLLALGLPEDVGGAGCGLAEEALLFRELGRQLAPGPFLATVLAGHVAWAAGDTALAASIAAGTAPVAFLVPAADGAGDRPASGPGQLRDWAGAEHALVLSPGAAMLVAIADLGTVTAVTSIDAGVRVADVMLGDIVPTHTAPDSAAALYLRGLVLVAAQLVGIAEACRDASVRYAKTREQFGRPIGVNQAVKHACAEMAVNAERAYAQLLFAAATGDSGPDAEFHARTAKAVATEAAQHNAAANLQIHGGMGFTTEFDAHLYVERAEVLEHTLATRIENLTMIIDLPAPQ